MYPITPKQKYAICRIEETSGIKYTGPDDKSKAAIFISLHLPVSTVTKENNVTTYLPPETPYRHYKNPNAPISEKQELFLDFICKTLNIRYLGRKTISEAGPFIRQFKFKALEKAEQEEPTLMQQKQIEMIAKIIGYYPKDNTRKMAFFYIQKNMEKIKELTEK